ncbi:MAG: hypothetical protein WC781_05175 [Candidatus Pacearchaeota archaeon]|jgi:hypothetical protein
MKADRTFLLIKDNPSAKLLRILDILWIIFLILLFFIANKFDINQKYILSLSLFVFSLYNLYFLYFKRINLALEDWSIPKDDLINYYIKYNKLPKFELIILGLLLVFSICIILV